MKLNIGCGESKYPDFVNIDLEPSTQPDLLLDVRHDYLPYAVETVDEVWMIHCIEHIERKYWHHIFSEIHRVLKPNGPLILGYPEFSVVARYFIEDKNRNRGFWLNTLYGRQLYPGDYHVTGILSSEMVNILEAYRFYRIKYQSEPEGTEYDYVMTAKKNPEPLTYDAILASELGLVGEVKSLGDL